MGWLFTKGQSRKALIDELTRSEGDVHCLSRACSGNTLWAVFEREVLELGFPPTVNKHRFIVAFLMQKQANFGWGYKPIEESMGPIEVTCPMKFLEMVPEVPVPYGYEWRRRVVAHHQRIHQKLVVGQVVKLTNGDKYKIESVSPLRGWSLDTIGLYRIPRRMLTLQEAQ